MKRQADRGVPKHVFAALERAKPVLVECLKTHGVVGVEYGVGFVHPYSIWVWLVTNTDAARDDLGGNLPLFDEVGEVLAAAGLPVEDAHFDGTVAQSQETVDRAYEASWFYAMR